MPGALTTTGAVLVAVAIALVFPTVQRLGAFRSVQLTGSRDCITVPELKACEEVALHAETGLLYLACSTPRDRLNWLNWLADVKDRKQFDYLATYDASTRAIARLSVAPGGTFDATQTVAFHGLDLVPSASDPNELFLYVVNHRLPADVRDFVANGTDSVIEVFTTRVGSTTLQHLHTFRDPAVIISPNDVSGSPEGKSLYFTNSEGRKMSWRHTFLRILEMFRATSSVGYCHVDKGCSFAMRQMPGVNGIVRAPQNNTLYVASSTQAEVLVHETREDGAIVRIATIPVGLPLDNLSMDQNGVIWAAAFPKSIVLASCLQDDTFQCRSPSTVFAVSRLNSSTPYKVDRVFEDDGSLVSAMTVAVHDAERKRLFMSGVLSPWLTVCNL